MSRLCGALYGKRRDLTCKRLAGHPGPHATRMSLNELRAVLAINRAGKR